MTFWQTYFSIRSLHFLKRHIGLPVPVCMLLRSPVSLFLTVSHDRSGRASIFDGQAFVNHFTKIMIGILRFNYHHVIEYFIVRHKIIRIFKVSINFVANGYIYIFQSYRNAGLLYCMFLNTTIVHSP